MRVASTGMLLLCCATSSVTGFAPRAAARHHTTGRRRRAALQAIDTSTALQAIDSFYRTSPIEAATLTCGVKAAASDSISQRREADLPFCFTRNRVFMIYGALYQGAAQHVIYNELYPRVFGSDPAVSTVLHKVLFDQLVHAPFLALPTIYLLKAAVFEYPLREGLQRYVADARRDLLWKYWLLWTPVQCATFSVVPEHLRIPFIAAVSFVWLIILSSLSSREDAESA